MEKNDKVIIAKGRFTNYVMRDQWEYVERKGAAGVVGIVAVTDADELVLVEQYRPPVDANVIELPAGLVGDGNRAAEPLEEAARRELLEETGFEAGQVRHLATGVTTAGISAEMIHLYLATKLRRVHAGGGDETETITVHLVPRRNVDPWLRERQQQGAVIDLKIYSALALIG